MFSCGWHLTGDGPYVYSGQVKSAGEYRRPAREAHSPRAWNHRLVRLSHVISGLRAFPLWTSYQLLRYSNGLRTERWRLPWKVVLTHFDQLVLPIRLSGKAKYTNNVDVAPLKMLRRYTLTCSLRQLSKGNRRRNRVFTNVTVDVPQTVLGWVYDSEIANPTLRCP